MKDIHRMTKAELIAHIAALDERVAQSDLARADLLDTEERLRAILQTAVEGIITIDERGLIETVNPAAERIFGYGSAELTGQNVKILMPDPYREQHDGYIASYRQTGHRKIIGIGREVVGQRKDGTIFPMDLSVSEVRLANGGRIFTGIVRDITERKRLEREILGISERERQRIGQDLHDDLGQRLTAIELLSQVLEQDLADRAIPEAAQAKKIAARVREAIAQTRSLAHGLAPVELQPDGLCTALEELSLQTGQLLRGTCTLHATAGIRVPDRAVATHLYRIAQEATNNAIKHGKAAHLRISLEEREKALVLTITDDGTGLREGFETAAGMGLSIMQYRAGMIGATLDIANNQSGTGATVLCIVPVAL